MVNSPSSWHDSDDIDSDLEQQAYSLLYYDSCVKDKSNLEENTVSNNKEYNELKSISDNDDNLVINLLNSSDSTIDLIQSSDSDSSASVQIIKCSKVDSALCVGSSSDESEYEAIQSVLESNNSSLILNIVSDKQEIKAVTNEQESYNNVENLFFDVKSSDINWPVDYNIPTSKNRFSNRYYESNSKSVCGICTKKGHTDEQCVRTGPACISCGKEGHNNRKCDTVICFSCFQNDHRTKCCPSTKKFLSLGCKRCGHRGHSEKICPDIWRQYKYTVTPGAPVFKRCSSQNKSNVFCANCAKSGHFTEQCPKNRMNSHFLGPPPIMEIVKFDEFDIYQKAGIKYSTQLKTTFNEKEKSSTSEAEFPSFMEHMDVTTMIVDKSIQESDRNEIEMKHSQFGDGFIMLSPIVKETAINENSQFKNRQSKPIVDSSTLRQPHQSHNGLVAKVPIKLPGITTELLKKLFPDETANLEKLPPYLRKKLRKKLKNFIDHGYLPGDSNMTQERMEFWLQQISTGRTLNYREKKKLLGSVSAALHSISDRVSSVEMVDCSLNSSATAATAAVTVANDTDNLLSIPDKRKRKNRNSRIEKSLKNSLKISRKEKKLARKQAESEQDNIKGRLRRSSLCDDNEELRPKKPKFKKRKSKKVYKEIIGSLKI